MTRICYTSMTDVKHAADIPSGVDMDGDIQRAMEEGTASVEEQLRRYFYPILTTRYFQWPPSDTQSSQLLRLGKHGLITKTGMVLVNGDGSTINNTRLHLAPARYGPPFTKIQFDGAFASNGTFPDKSIQITGLFGYRDEETLVTASTTQLTGTTVEVGNASRIGVGSLIRIGTERLVVTAKGGWINSGNLAAITLADKNSADTFTVTNGSFFHVGEEILIGSEVMQVQRIAVNTLTVKRAVDGSALQTHTATATVFVDRRLTVERAVLGTTAADTASGADVYLFRFPALVAQLCRAEVLTILGFDQAAYAVSSGSDDAKVRHSTKPIENLRKRCFEAHGRLLVG